MKPVVCLSLVLFWLVYSIILDSYLYRQTIYTYFLCWLIYIYIYRERERVGKIRGNCETTNYTSINSFQDTTYTIYFYWWTWNIHSEKKIDTQYRFTVFSKKPTSTFCHFRLPQIACCQYDPTYYFQNFHLDSSMYRKIQIRETSKMDINY